MVLDALNHTLPTNRCRFHQNEFKLYPSGYLSSTLDQLFLLGNPIMSDFTTSAPDSVSAYCSLKMYYFILFYFHLGQYPSLVTCNFPTLTHNFIMWWGLWSLSWGEGITTKTKRMVRISMNPCKYRRNVYDVVSGLSHNIVKFASLSRYRSDLPDYWKVATHCQTLKECLLNVVVLDQRYVPLLWYLKFFS
jgi:hypothetical protein